MTFSDFFERPKFGGDLHVYVCWRVMERHLLSSVATSHRVLLRPLPCAERILSVAVSRDWS